VADTAFFWIGKIVWGIASPSHFAVLLLLGSFFIHRFMLRTILRSVAIFILTVAFFLPVGDWALVPLEQCTEQQSLPMNVDGVIVLGGAVNLPVTDARESVVFNNSADRMMTFLKLMKIYPKAQFVYAGGSSSIKHPDFHEADYIKRFLGDMGIDTSKMVFEGYSRSTFEDAVATQSVYGKTAKQSWLIVTSAYHMPRALSLFQKRGASSETRFSPYAADYKTSGKFAFDFNVDLLGNLGKLDIAAHEYVGLIVNRLMNRSDAFMPCSIKQTVIK
jgi:uncharacterized SAM-binding protein YcdF (DUF218 family)